MAHEHCVVNRDLAKIKLATFDFLKENAVVFTANYFLKEVRANQVRSRRVMARTITECLTMAANEACRRNSGPRLEAIEKFAQTIGDRLFLDIDVPTGIL